MRDTRTAQHRGASHWLMLDLIQRKIGLDTHRLYEEREPAEGRALQDWLKAQSDVLKRNVLAPLWRSQRRRPPKPARRAA